MQQLATQDEIRMTSVDLAKLTGKQHAHVMRDIRNELNQLSGIDASIFGLVDYTDKKGEKRPCYQFGKKGAMQLALKYDAMTRYKVIEYIEKLEEEYNSPEKTIARALILADAKLKELKPYADFGKAITADDGILIGEYCKILANTGIVIGQNKLFQWLRDNRYLIRTGERRNQPMQKYVDMGIFALKETPIEKGNVKFISFTTLITGKGQKYFIEKLRGYNQ